jgi:hypothetical protein
MIKAGKKHGVEVTISTAPAGVTGEIAPLPGVKRPQMTEAEQKAWEARMKAAGITVTDPEISPALLTEAEAGERARQLKAAGIKMAEPDPGTATIYLLDATDEPEVEP